MQFLTHNLLITVSDDQIRPMVMDKILGREFNGVIIPDSAIVMPQIGEYWKGEGGVFTGILPSRDGTGIDLVITGPRIDEQAEGYEDIKKKAEDVEVDGHKDFRLPYKAEQSLQKATIPQLFKTDDWYWSIERHPDGEYGAYAQDLSMAVSATSARAAVATVARSADHHNTHADFSFTEVVQAHEDCRRHKRNKETSLQFERDQERNLVQLYRDLKAGTYRPGTSVCFVIKRPKYREVWAACFRDRIVHHLLYNRVKDRFYKSFIADSCACIPGRGTLYGAERLEHKIRSITQNWSKPAFYLKIDIANFFCSINKRIVAQLLASRIQEPWWLNLAETILLHDPRSDVHLQSRACDMARIQAHKSLFNQPDFKGLPIGNISSQFFANILLDQLDQFCKHVLRAKHYHRYVDDMIILHESPQQLNEWLRRIEEFLPAVLDLKLNTSKTVLQPIPRGVDFVGQLVRPWHRRIRKRTRNDALNRLQHMPAAELYESANSYFGLFRQATHSHSDRVQLSNLLLRRGHAVNQKLTKAYKQKGDSNAH